MGLWLGGAGGSSRERGSASDSPPEQLGGAGGSSSERGGASDSPPEQLGSSEARP
jgi:hypothetical protein